MAQQILTQKEISSKHKKLGLAGSINTISNSSLDRSESKDVFFGTDYKIDLESGGTFTRPEPTIIVKKQTRGEILSNKNIIFSYKAFGFKKEKEYIYSKYQFIHKLIGNLSFFSAPKRFLSLQKNKFFNKFNLKKYFVKNSFPFIRLSFPKNASNTSQLIIQRPNNQRLRLIPFIENKYTKKDLNKNYLLWNNSFLNVNSNQSREKFPTATTNTFNEFYIPYPNTVEIQQYNKFNLPLKIAAYGNDTKIEGGLLVITTGDNQHQEICYVSPHDIKTGIANTVEKFRIKKQLGSFVLKKHQSKDVLEISRGIGNISFPTNLTGIYTECPVLNKFGKKTFLKYSNITGDNSDKNIMIWWDGASQESGMLPPNIKGQWVISSGRLGWFNGKNGPERTLQSLQDYGEGGFLKFVNNASLYTSGPEITSLPHPENSLGWTKLSDNSNVGSLMFNFTKAENIANRKIALSGFANIPSIFQVRSFFLDSNDLNSGLLPNGIQNTYETGAYNMFDASGVVHRITGGHFTYKINSHLQQETPLKDTYFYKFYNNLYSASSNKTISTGIWDGIIPANTNFSIELISTKLNSNVGLNNDLYIVYSGYGSEDEIDLISQKYINSKFLGENFKNIKYDTNKKTISYTSYTRSDEKSSDFEIIARKAATKRIQNYIYKAIKYILPEALSPNRKFISFMHLLDKLAIRYPASSDAPLFSTLPIEIQSQNRVPTINSSSSSSSSGPEGIPLPSSSSSSSSSSSEIFTPGPL